MSLSKKALLVLSGVVLSGCSLAPAYTQPETVVDRAVILKPGDTERQYQFRELFAADPQLSRVLEYALINNYDYLQGIEKVRAARAQKNYSIFELIPGIGYGVSKDIRTTSTASPFTGESIKQKTQGYQSSLGIDSYEVDIWGKKISEIGSRGDELKASESSVAALRLTLMKDVANAWYEALSMIKIWHGLNEKLRLTEQVQSGLEAIDRQDRLDAVVMSKFLRSRSGDASRRESLAREINNRIHQIEFLSGYRSDWLNVDSWQSLSGEYLVPDIPQQIASDVIFNRPDVIAAEMNIRAANGIIGVARASFLPMFKLYASAWKTSDRFQQVLGGLNDNWALTPSLIAPVFDWPKDYANLKYAHSQQTTAVIEYRKTVAQALRDIQDRTNNLSKYAEMNEILQQEAGMQQSNLHRVTRRYDAGYSDLYAWYEALDLSTTAQVELESNRQQMMSNVIGLIAAIGG